MDRLFQKAIAADPKSTVAGYLLGALCWVSNLLDTAVRCLCYYVQFTIPFCISTTFGLGAAALEHTPSW